MTSNDSHEATGGNPSVNPGFAAAQLAKALLARERHTDPALAQGAEQRVAAWQAILDNILTGAAQYGSRTPLPEVPAWATPEVATGGFATGRLLAGGPLEVYERNLLARLAMPEDEHSRLRLNTYFLTDAGIGELLSWLDSGQYAVRYPEEGALLTVAWLTRQQESEAARAIVSAISPFFATLRFYPVPDYRTHRYDAGVHVQDVAATRAQLHRIRPHPGILAQRASVHVWAPLHDRLLALFAEATAGGDWPCRTVPADWTQRATVLLGEFDHLEQQDAGPSKYRKPGSHYVQLRGYLRQSTHGFETLSPKDVARIRHILEASIAKRGLPLSAQSEAIRQRQRADVAGPLHADVARIVAQRLQDHDQTDGLDDPEPFLQAVAAHEANASVPAGTAVPVSVRRKVRRSLNDSLDALVRGGWISSGEAMAKVLPQLTAGLHGLGIEDRSLRQLYAAIYRAFRRRRSLLLLNLDSQVRIGELPWVAAIDRFRRTDLPDAAAARQALEQLAMLALECFPHAILPNKLVRELGALASRAGVDIPLVDELAVDIFMGEFAPKFTQAAKLAGDLLRDSLYAAYYRLDADQLDRLGSDATRPKLLWARPTPKAHEEFARLCAARAGVKLGSWRPATNGMIIEQQQILTTQNLAALVAGLGLQDALRGRFAEMARSCFRWICRRNQMRLEDWHARMILVKNSAYAWRQMIFYLSMLPDQDVQEFLDWSREHYEKQSTAFQAQFHPVLDGFRTVAAAFLSGKTLSAGGSVQPFLGWSDGEHRL